MLRRVLIATVGLWVLLATVAVVPALAACPEWSVIASRNPQPNFNILNDVSALSATDAWAVGTSGQGSNARPLIEHWDGMAWSVVPGPSTSTSFLGLNGVVAISPTNVWAVGNKGSASRPLILHYNGTKWSVAGSGTPGKGFANVGLDSIAAIAPDDIWAVGTSVRSAQVWRPLVEHWDGQHWRVVTVPNPVTTINTLVDVSAVSTGDVWAVGWFGLANQTPLVEHWNGSRWARVATPSIASGGSLAECSGIGGVQRVGGRRHGPGDTTCAAGALERRRLVALHRRRCGRGRPQPVLHRRRVVGGRAYHRHWHQHHRLIAAHRLHLDAGHTDLARCQ